MILVRLVQFYFRLAHSYLRRVWLYRRFYFRWGVWFHVRSCVFKVRLWILVTALWLGWRQPWRVWWKVWAWLAVALVISGLTITLEWIFAGWRWGIYAIGCIGIGWCVSFYLVARSRRRGAGDRTS